MWVLMRHINHIFSPLLYDDCVRELLYTKKLRKIMLIIEKKMIKQK